MANGVLCKKCGWCESAHDDPTGMDLDTVRPGYSISLRDCDRFSYSPEDPEASKLPPVQRVETDRGYD